MKIKLVTVSARPRPEMLRALTDYQDRVEEHLFKLYAFGNQMPDIIRQWVKSLNSYMYPLRLRNKGKGDKQNVVKDYVIKKYVEHGFDDLQVLKIWNDSLNNDDPNYTLLKFDDGDLIKIRKLASSYVDALFSESRFEPDPKLFKD